MLIHTNLIIQGAIVGGVIGGIAGAANAESERKSRIAFRVWTEKKLKEQLQIYQEAEGFARRTEAREAIVATLKEYERSGGRCLSDDTRELLRSFNFI